MSAAVVVSSLEKLRANSAMHITKYHAMPTKTYRKLLDRGSCSLNTHRLKAAFLPRHSSHATLQGCGVAQQI